MNYLLYMKHLFESWRSFLLTEGLDDYNVSGATRLFHYSKSDEQKLTLDPDYFLQHRHSYSRRDYEASDLPRVFFYTNLDHAERIVKDGSSLFTAFVPTDQIYDLSQDPLGLVKKSIVPGRVTPDVDAVLRSLAGTPRQSKYGPPPELLIEPGESKYRGAFYRTGNMDVVVWFEPIEVEKFNPDDVESGQGNESENQ